MQSPRTWMDSNPVKPLHEWLRERRLKRGIDLALLAEQTKIPRRHFEAIEEGAIQLLPEGVYRRGFIRAYLVGIGIPEPERIDELVRAATAERPDSRPGETNEVRLGSARHGRAGWLIGLLLAVVLLAGFLLWHEHEKRAGHPPELGEPELSSEANRTQSPPSNPGDDDVRQ